MNVPSTTICGLVENPPLTTFECPGQSTRASVISPGSVDVLPVCLKRVIGKGVSVAVNVYVEVEVEVGVKVEVIVTVGVYVLVADGVNVDEEDALGVSVEPGIWEMLAKEDVAVSCWPTALAMAAFVFAANVWLM